VKLFSCHINILLLAQRVNQAILNFITQKLTLHLVVKFILLPALFLFSTTTFAKQILNVYNWADYLPNTVIKQFEQETGIQVNYTEYDSNETLYAKLKTSPQAGYDVIFPSSYFVDRMRKENMLLKLDMAKLSNVRHLNPELMHQAFDPHNEFSVPYLWGTTGIVINKKFIKPNTVKSWSDFWRPEYQNQLLLFDDVREVFAIALFRLGYSINDTNSEHIKQAYMLLKQLWPNIKLFNIEAEQNIYIDEDAFIGMGLNGEIFNAISENPNLEYIYPKDGFEIWMDSITIPKNAPHKEAAYQFINFLLRPEIAKEISISLGFSTPNLSAAHMLPDEMRNSPIVNPDNHILKRGQYLIDLGETNMLYEKYWNKLKTGE
jgi:spermidine/putrescine transport system substrate-binding protein